MSQQYIWRVFCTSSNQYETTISATAPTVCPSDGSPINTSLTTIVEAIFYDVVSNGYVNVESQLADNQALKINASNTNGGIIITAGLGGILANTTNAISFNGAAASNFTTSNGNLSLNATSGLVNIDAGSGINIGNGSTTNPILIGTSNYLKNITIGSTYTTSTTTINSGTGGIAIGNNTNAGEIDIATAVTDKTISIGNISTNSRIFNRFGGGGMIKSQTNPVFVYGNQNTTILTAHLLIGILYGTTTQNCSLDLPNASNVVSGISGSQVTDSIDFSVVNLGTFTYTIVLGTNGSMIGNTVVNATASGLFKLVLTNITSGSEAYTIYRLA